MKFLLCNVSEYMETNILETISTQEITINLARESDVVEAFYITKVVIDDLLKRSILHKDIFSNPYDNLKAHIENESLYILKKKGISLAMMTFGEEEPEELKQVNWEFQVNSYFYISRIFVLPNWRNMGIGSLLLSFAENLAQQRGYQIVHIDINSALDEGNLMVMKHNYHFAGNVFSNFQKSSVNYYEKHI